MVCPRSLKTIPRRYVDKSEKTRMCTLCCQTGWIQHPFFRGFLIQPPFLGMIRPPLLGKKICETKNPTFHLVENLHQLETNDSALISEDDTALISEDEMAPISGEGVLRFWDTGFQKLITSIFIRYSELCAKWSVNLGKLNKFICKILKFVPLNYEFW